MRNLTVDARNARVIEGRAVLCELGAGVKRLGRIGIAERVVVLILVTVFIAVSTVFAVGIDIVTAGDEHHRSDGERGDEEKDS